MVLSLAKNDFKQRFAGSYFGIMWAFVNPVVTIMLYWFVFTIGFRNPQSNGSYPFVLWLIAGLIPWFLFSEALTSGTNALLEYSYLVKKVVFKIDILPIVKIMSASVVHFFLPYNDGNSLLVYGISTFIISASDYILSDMHVDAFNCISVYYKCYCFVF